MTANTTKPPPWARKNAERLLDSIKTSDLIASISTKAEVGFRLSKPKVMREIKNQISRSVERGVCRKLSRDSFAFLALVFLEEDSHHGERALALDCIKFKFEKNGISYLRFNLVTLSFHCLMRIAERDIKSFTNLIPFLISEQNISRLSKFNVHVANNVMPTDDHAAYAFPFGHGYITGTFRYTSDGSANQLLVSDARTFLLDFDKPLWKQLSHDGSPFLTNYKDRKSLAFDKTKILENIFPNDVRSQEEIGQFPLNIPSLAGDIIRKSLLGKKIPKL